MGDGGGSNARVVCTANMEHVHGDAIASKPYSVDRPQAFAHRRALRGDRIAIGDFAYDASEERWEMQATVVEAGEDGGCARGGLAWQDRPFVRW